MRQPATAPVLHITIGDVFEVEDGPSTMRGWVLACDENLVMYDVWWPHRQAWSMAKLLGDFAYYRLSRGYLQAHARHIGTEPLSAKELQIHQPDLPFAVAQRDSLSWYDPSWLGAGLRDLPVLAASTIHLSPFGPRDSAKPPALLTADNGEAFTEQELMTKAKALQDQFIGDVRLTNGVGIYRSGIKKRIPSYYIWGVKSRFDEPPKVLAHAAKRA